MINQLFRNVLVPPFLRSLNYHLLINHHVIWASRVHFVLYYGAMSFVLLALWAWVYPVSPIQLPSIPATRFISCMVALGAAGFWLYKQRMHCVEAGFGMASVKTDRLRLLLNACCLLVFVLFPAMATTLATSKIAQTVSPQQLAEDINTLNLGNPYFPTTDYHDSLFHKQVPQLCRKFVEIDGSEFVDGHPRAYACEQEECPGFHYSFERFKLDEKLPDASAQQKLMSEKDMNTDFVQTTDEQARLARIRRYIEVAQRYDPLAVQLDHEEPAQVLARFYQGKFIDQPYKLANQKERISRQLRLIGGAQYVVATPSQWIEWTLGGFCIIALLSPVLLMYQNLGLRNFLLSAVVASVMLTVIGSIFVLILVENSPGNPLFPLLVFLLVVGVALGVKLSATRNLKQFSWFACACLLAASVLSTGTLFLLLVIIRIACVKSVPFHVTNDFLLLVAGMMTFTFYYWLLIPLFKKWYLQLKALPNG